MQKDKLVLVTDPEIIAAIERNGFGDPVPVEKNEQGYWVYAWSLEQWRERPAQHDSGVQVAERVQPVDEPSLLDEAARTL